LNPNRRYARGERAHRILGLTVLALILVQPLLSITLPLSNAEPDIIYVPDEYQTIQAAINNANEGDTIIVRSGTYYEDILVEKRLTIQGEDRETTTIVGGGYWSVVEIYVGKVKFSGFTVTNGEHGVYLDHSDYSTISDVTVFNCKTNGIYGYISRAQIINCTSHENHDGIHFDFSDFASVIDCISYNNSDDGISLFDSDYVQILNCYLYDNDDGLALYDTESVSMHGIESFGNDVSGLSVKFSERFNVSSSSFFDNSGDGINFRVSQGVVFNCNITSNWDDGVEGIESDIRVRYCSITQNSDNGVENDLSAIDARDCWWGDASGPYNPSVNPFGTGDQVDDDIEFDPWLTSLYRALVLVIGVSGSGTTDPVPGTYTYGEDTGVSVDAIPDSGWVLSHWLLDGVDVGDDDSYTVTMDDDHSLTAVFEEVPIEDVAPPVIMDVYQQPARDSVDPDVEVEVYATITDDLSGVRKAILNYTTNDEEWFTVNMANLGSDLYMATIPQLPSGIYVAYVINAVDEAGNTVTEKEMGYQIAVKGVTSSSNIFILAGLGAITLITAILIIVVLRKTR